MKKIFYTLIIILALVAPSYSQVALKAEQDSALVYQKQIKGLRDSLTKLATAVRRANSLNVYTNNKLDSIVNALNGTISSTLTTSPSSVTTSGTIAAGARFIVLETSSDFVGTINSLLFQANGFLCYPINPDTRYPAIPYTVSAGTLYIRKFN